MDAHLPGRNMKRSRKALIAGALLLAAIHFGVSWVAFMKSELIRPTAATEYWKFAARVLAFPLIYGSNASGSVDLFPLLMVANSVLWGVAVWLTARWVLMAIRRSSEPR
jgi:hypothetical protein